MNKVFIHINSKRSLSPEALLLIIVMVFLVLLSGSAYSETSFAMFPMEIQGNISPETVEEVQVGLNQFLIESKKYLLVDRQRVNLILKEQAFQHSGLTDQNTIIKLGKIFNVEKFINTVLYLKTGSHLTLRCSVIDVTTGQVELVKKLTMPNNPPETLGRYCAGEIIAAYPLIGKIEGSTKDTIVVNLGEKHGLTNGDSLFVARKKIVVADDGKVLFSELVRAGTLEVISASESWSKTKITQLADGITSITKDDIVSIEPIPKNKPKISSAPLLKTVKKGELILEDDMKKHQYLSVWRNEGNSYKRGKLQLASPLKSSGPAFCFYPPPFDRLQNFILEGEMEFNKLENTMNYFKIYFRASHGQDKQFKGYALFFNPDALYALSIDGNEKNNYISPFTSTPHFNRGTSENKFKIVAYDSKFDIYVNDKHLISFEDELYMRGTVGLLVNIGTSVSVSNISIWKAEKE